MTKPLEKKDNKDSKKDKKILARSGRFASGPAAVMEQINASIDIDKRLWREDIQGSKAHCEMLIAQNIISDDDGQAILGGLEKVAEEIETGAFQFKPEHEDIHMNIEHRLYELIGDTAGKLHTARSRNDQVATDFRLWTRTACNEISAHIEALKTVLKKTAHAHSKTIMPGFTHLQVAQPVTLAMHLNAYAQMMARDKSRFKDCRNRLNESPLGACALSGTGFPTNREMTAKALGFNNVMSSTMDAVSARDFANEFLFACAQCGLHLSRLAEEIIIWVTPQFNFMQLDDAWATGSSIMPQKKNPDAAELVRAKTGRLNANLVQLMTVMKALPLAYNKDMQEDKACVFESFDTLMLCLRAMTGMIESAKFNPPVMREAAESGFATATEIADWLVREAGMAFRDAYHVTGKLVGLAAQKECRLDELSLDEMQNIAPQITGDIYKSLNLDDVIKSRQKNG